MVMAPLWWKKVMKREYRWWKKQMMMAVAMNIVRYLDPTKLNFV